MSDELTKGCKGINDFEHDKPEEACGVFGTVAPGREVSRLTFFALFALQHRGQESAGIAVDDNGHLTAIKDMGLVSQIFNEQTLKSLPGQAAIGHVRYSTTGSTHWANAQPVCLERNGHTLAVAHNGNIVNTAELREMMGPQGLKLNSTSDSELLARLIANDPAEDIRDAVAESIPKIKGAFSVVLLSQGAVVGFRDPWGVRPLCVGKLDDGNYALASESCALDIIGAEFLQEIEPGQMAVITEGNLELRQVVEPAERQGFCIFEYIYFARPDSNLGGLNVSLARNRMGEELARESLVEADMVIPIPDTGTPAAIGFARASGVPYGEGLIKNRYVGRTFIQPDQDLRQHGIRVKLNPLSEAIRGKSLVVVDDSIVRGNTTRKLVKMLYESGATEVHLRISSPPITHPCFYGIDTSTSTELIASEQTVEQIRQQVGADSLEYISLEGLQRAVGKPAENFCRACFTGRYPVEVPDLRKMSKHRFEQVEKENGNGKAKEAAGSAKAGGNGGKPKNGKASREPGGKTKKESVA
ncbi:MAG: amidophosphoribosyltransferase [Actinobacteria bacterium]|nr:amidophosphoribosyltransferase [Actinomycetota bacterium]MCL5882915.1 amidophosphoribosyltransferase [Actinomycetota bacterium]